MRENYPYLNNLELADTGGGGDIDLLIGTDFYWTMVDGNVKRDESEAPVALSSKFGWILSGPIGDKTISDDVIKINFVDTQRMPIENITEKKLGDKVSNFWNLDVVGSKENEQSVYEKCVSEIGFENGRYVVKLPFKENVTYR